MNSIEKQKEIRIEEEKTDWLKEFNQLKNNKIIKLFIAIIVKIFTKKQRR